jgi:hypothetical protein
MLLYPTMITVRVLDAEERAWLDCPFCGTREYSLAARIVGAPAQSFPKPEELITYHFVLNSTESHRYAPCGQPPAFGLVTEWRLIDQEADKVLACGEARFSQFATMPAVSRMWTDGLNA